MARSRTRLAADWFAKLRLDNDVLTTQDDIDACLAVKAKYPKV